MARHGAWKLCLPLVLAAAGLLAQPLVVKDEDGRPVAGAKVEVLWYGEGGLFSLLTPAHLAGWTDEEGRWPHQVPVGVRGMLLVDHPHFPPLLLPLDKLSDRQLVLRRRSWQGRIAGKPAAGGGRACLVATLALGEETRRLRRCALVDEEGAFALPQLPLPADLRLVVPGFATWQGKLEQWPDEPWQLAPGFSLAGEVRDCNGEPLEGVRLSWQGGEEESWSDGSFLLGLSQLPAELRVSPPVGEATSVTVTGDEQAPLILRLACPPLVRATLLSPAGAFDGVVTAVLTPSPCAEGCSTEAREVRVRQGELRLLLPEAGGYELELLPSGFAPLKFIAEARAGEPVNLGVVPLEVGARVAGSVVDAASGLPLAGATVEAVAVGAQGYLSLRGAARYATVSNGEGQFLLGGLPRARYLVKVTAPQRAAVYRLVSLAEDKAVSLGRMALGEGVVVSGQVADAFERPMEGVELRLRDPACEFPESLAQTTADEQGRFRLPPLAPGRYRLEVWQQDQLLLGQERLLRRAEELALLTTGVELSGTVSENGVLLPGVDLLFSSLVGAWEQRAVLQLRTEKGTLLWNPRAWSARASVGEDGRFRLAGVPPGPVRVSLFRAGVERARPLAVPAARQAEVSLELGGEVLQGRVVASPSAERPWLWLRDATGFLLAGGAVASDGSFVLEGLPAGSATLELSGRSGTLLRVALELPREEELTLVPPGKVPGGLLRLAFLRREEPVRGLEVVFFPEGAQQPSLARMVTGAELTLPELPTGPGVVAWYEPLSGVASRSVQIREGSQELSVSLPVGADLSLHCSAPHCAGSAVEELHLICPEGLDLAPLLSGWRANTRLDEDGRLSLGRVAPGRWRLSLRFGGHSYERTLHVTEGEAAELVFP